MMEQTVHLLSDDLELEGLIDRQDEKRGVVVTHPHPLYGGDLHNHVVEIIRQAYAKRKYTTLRFNFRGVGRSQGRYDEGRGEQNDVRAAVAFLIEKGIRQVDLAGYSFGAWVNALAVTGGLQADRLVMVSPPAALIDFAKIGVLPNLHQVVTGSRDDIAPPALIDNLLQEWNPRLQLNIVEGADHFYGGYSKELEKMLVNHLETSGSDTVIGSDSGN